MKKFPRSGRTRRSFPRTVILARRGGAAASEGGGLGDQTFYVASVPGGKADLVLTFVAGVAQSVAAAVARSWDLFNETLGEVSALQHGFGWDGAGALAVPHIRFVGVDTFETYDTGAVSEGALTGGSHWNGSAVLHAY